MVKDKYTISCAELRGLAQSLNGNIEKLRQKADDIQKAVNKVTRGDHKASDLSAAYTAQTALSGSIGRLDEICGAMDSAALQFAEASAELSGRANLTAYYMQHTDTLDYDTLIKSYSAAIVSTGSAVAGYELVKDALRENGYAVDDIGAVRNITNAPYTIHQVPASGYAELCNLAYDAAKSKKDPCAAFADKIRNSGYIPENSSLKYISEHQVSYHKSPSGFTCFVIRDGENAIVVFLGTNDAADLLADGTLAVGLTPIQTLEARHLTKQITEQYKNVVVTGHSLGGHLATDVTLNNKDVDSCIAFEAPGRYDGLYQMFFNQEQNAKIKTYNANGSIISAVGGAAGNEERVDVKFNSTLGNDLNHSIKEVRNALVRTNDHGRATGSR